MPLQMGKRRPNATQLSCESLVILIMRCRAAADKAGECEAHYKLAHEYFTLSLFTEARDSYNAARLLARDTGDHVQEVLCMLGIGKVNALHNNPNNPNNSNNSNNPNDTHDPR